MTFGLRKPSGSIFVLSTLRVAPVSNTLISAVFEFSNILYNFINFYLILKPFFVNHQRTKEVLNILRVIRYRLRYLEWSLSVTITFVLVKCILVLISYLF